MIGVDRPGSGRNGSNAVATEAYAHAAGAECEPDITEERDRESPRLRHGLEASAVLRCRSCDRPPKRTADPVSAGAIHMLAMPAHRDVARSAGDENPRGAPHAAH